MAWWVYMLRCRDGSLYTGVTTDVERRFAQHRAGTGAKYTRTHPPEAIVYREELPDKPAALRRELALKGLRREAKLRPSSFHYTEREAESSRPGLCFVRKPTDHSPPKATR